MTTATRAAPGLPGVVVGLSTSAVLALAVWGSSPYARYLDHGYAPASMVGRFAALALFMAGWALMIAATMLPSAASLVGLATRVGERRLPRGAIQLLVATGFLSTWLAVGYLFALLDVAVHAGVDVVPRLSARPELVAAGLLVLAGGFQFTQSKHACLTACRSPANFVYRYWHGVNPCRDSVRIGAAYGVSCVGCCWALMLVMFGLGAGNVGWMLAAGVVVALEKNASFGHWLGSPLGVALIVVGVWVALA